jgi:ATP-binding cassette subfamily B protein
VQFNAYLLQLTWPMVGLGWSLNLFQQGSASMERIREVMDRAPAITDASEVVEREMRGELELRHVSLAYGEREVLHDLCLRVPAGATVAIVGPTGAGKSSLLNLIPRVFDATDGAVLVDGVDVRRWSLDALRRQIGYVPQETFLFSTSLAENVAYGRDDAPEERVVWAAQVAHLSGDVETFPQGFATTIGERGVTLSGGQKQRTAIARAVFKDPRILLLDDALSSVDTHTEEQILHQLRGVLEGRTAIIVSHRVSTVRDADSIVVLDDGRIVEQGAHAELVQLGGLYAAMYRRQLLSEELDVEEEAV